MSLSKSSEDEIRRKVLSEEFPLVEETLLDYILSILSETRVLSMEDLSASIKPILTAYGILQDGDALPSSLWDKFVQHELTQDRRIEAMYRDGSWYPAEIVEQSSSDRSALVQFDGYEELETVELSKTRTRKSKIESLGKKGSIRSLGLTEDTSVPIPKISDQKQNENFDPVRSLKPSTEKRKQIYCSTEVKSDKDLVFDGIVVKVRGEADCFGDDGEYTGELMERALTTWPASKIAEWIRRILLKVEKCSKQRRTILESIADSIEKSDLQLDLILSLPEIIAEAITHRKFRPRSVKITINWLIPKLREATKINKRDGYWSILNDEDSLLTSQFKDSSFAPLIKLALTPQQRDAVLYTHLCLEPDTVSKVNSVHLRIDKNVRSHHRVQVVCVSSKDRADVVLQNYIYVCNEGTWVLLFSVDFARHGEAFPGHWHLNITPSGQLVQHWGLKGIVFHGNPEHCPRFWHLVPEGKNWYKLPCRDLSPI